MSDKPFRVLLDVTELNIEFVNYVWINVSPRELKTIADFKLNILKKLHIDRNIKLFLRDGLLLEEETVIILREDDTIKVKYEGELLSTHNFSSISIDDGTQNLLKKRSHSECNEHETITSKKRHKRANTLNSSAFDEVERSFEIKKDKKKKKSSRPHSLSFVENMMPSITDNDITDMDLTCVKVLDNVKDVTKKINEENINKNISCPENLNKIGELDVVNTSPVKSESEVLQGNNCRKKKRKRRRKRKDNSILETSSENNESSFIAEPVEIISNTASSSTAIRKHIIYTSPDPYHNTNVKENTEIKKLNSDVVLCKNDAEEQSAEVFIDSSENFTVSMSNGVSPEKYDLKLPVAVQNDGILEKMNCSSFSSSKNGSTNHKHTENAKRFNYAVFPVLNSMPTVGSHIVYKILELNEHYSPEVSDYKEGIVKNIDPETDEVEIELTIHEIKPGRLGKFENVYEDEIPPPQVIKTDKVSWSTLIEPRLIL